MSISYAQRQTTAQKKGPFNVASVHDSSSQSESLQRKANMANNAAQRAEAPRPNNTGMPDNLKSGIESLSGFSMDDVRVHYNSSKPATVQALAYTQGTDIHVAPGQEKHLPHEAWHVAQQMAGRVSPTTNINGMPVNDNVALEHEADVMGEIAVQCQKNNKLSSYKNTTNIIQCDFFEKKLDGSYLVQKGDPPETMVQIEDEYSDGKNTLPVYRNKLYHCFYCETDLTNPHIKDDAAKAGKRRADKQGRELILIPLNAKDVFPIEVDENIIIVSHGETVVYIDEKSSFKFANQDAEALAGSIAQLLPNGYRGEIYLDGCCTGLGTSPYKNNSYAQKFFNVLKNKYAKKMGEFSVKANLGLARTQDDGREGIDVNDSNRDFIAAQISEYLQEETFYNKMQEMEGFYSNVCKLIFTEDGKKKKITELVEGDLKITDSFLSLDILNKCQKAPFEKVISGNEKDVITFLNSDDDLIKNHVLVSDQGIDLVLSLYSLEPGLVYGKIGKKIIRQTPRR